jgi:hypothetical protein
LFQLTEFKNQNVTTFAFLFEKLAHESFLLAVLFKALCNSNLKGRHSGKSAEVCISPPFEIFIYYPLKLKRLHIGRHSSQWFSLMMRFASQKDSSDRIGILKKDHGFGVVEAILFFRSWLVVLYGLSLSP